MEKKTKVKAAAGAGATGANVEERLASKKGAAEPAVPKTKPRPCTRLVSCPVNSKDCTILARCGINTDDAKVK